MIVVTAKYLYQHGILARNVMTFDNFGYMHQFYCHFVIFARLGQLDADKRADVISQSIGFDDKLRTNDYAGVFHLLDSLMYYGSRHSTLPRNLQKGHPGIAYQVKKYLLVHFV
jgi:hypothetical protein